MDVQFARWSFMAPVMFFFSFSDDSMKYQNMCHLCRKNVQAAADASYLQMLNVTQCPKHCWHITFSNRWM